MAQAMVLEAVQIRQLLPVRPRFSHKGDFGRVLLVCGSVGFTGAAALAARAALRTGAGLITVATPRQVWPIVAAKLDEPMVMPMAEDKAGRLSLQAAPALVQLLAKADACLIGPGLGRSEELDALVAALVGEARCPVVLDADGINAMAGHIDRLREAACPLILTPHDGEFLRLSPGAALPPADFDTRADRAMMLARRLGAVVLLKGYRTAITDGTRLYRNEIAISAVDTPVPRAIASQASDELLNISGILASFVLYPGAEGEVMISARPDMSISYFISFLLVVTSPSGKSTSTA